MFDNNGEIFLNGGLTVRIDLFDDKQASPLRSDNRHDPKESVILARNEIGMTLTELCQMRLAHQQISIHQFGRPKEVVAWMGAMQAQDYNMAQWGVGVRLPDADRRAVQSAIDRGEIIRTHVLRPTWHLVAAKDIGWMLDLTASHIKASAKSRHKELELSGPLLNKCLRILEKFLSGGKHGTRDEVLKALNAKKIDTTGQRAAHILIWAELEKIICSGPLMQKKNTYALFGDRVREQKTITREEGLHRLALRYFTSRGPATPDDFMNWSGLPKADVKKAVGFVQRDLTHERIGPAEYWFKDHAESSAKVPGVYLLPAFDEFIIGYKDRSATLPPAHRSVAISINGIFWPTIVVNGRVTGLWKRTVAKNGQVAVELNYFPRSSAKNDPDIKKLTAAAIEDVRAFFGSGSVPSES